MTGEHNPPAADRRFFLKAGLAAVAAAGAATLVALGRFMMPRVLFEPPMQFVVGAPEAFPPGTVSTEFMDKQKVVLVHGEEGIYAFSSMCTHLGCPVNFDAQENLFRCPCHGSVFDLKGKVLGGPAPVPLYRTAVSLDPRGRIVVNKAVTATEVSPKDEAEFLITGVT